MIDYYNNETRLTEILRAVVNSSTIDLGPARTREEIFVSRAFGLTMWPAIPPRTTMEMWLAFIAGDAAEPAAGTYTVRTCAESCIITYARRVRGASAVVPIFVPHTHYERALAKLAGIVPLNWGVLGREWEHLLQILTSSTMPRSAVNVIGGEHVGIGPGGEVTPFQDLHGYDHPWPAGGGDNLAKIVKESYGGTVSNGLIITKEMTHSANFNMAMLMFGRGFAVESDEIFYISFDVRIVSGSFGGINLVQIMDNSQAHRAITSQISKNEPSYSAIFRRVTVSARADRSAGAWGIYIQGKPSDAAVLEIANVMVTRQNSYVYSPYSNICPIYPGLTLVRDDETTLVVWGGALDATTDRLTVTDAEIASYAGESLPGEWISDRDAYAAGAVPTTGAQVVYKLAEPATYQLTRAEVQHALNCAEYLGAGVWRLNCAGATIIRAYIRTESPTNHYDLAASNEDWSFTVAVDSTTVSGDSGIVSVAAGDHDVVIVATPGEGAGVCIIHPTLYYTAVAGLLGSRRDQEESVEPEEPEEPEEPAEPEEPEEPAEPEEPEEPAEPEEPVEPEEPEEPQTTKRRRKK